MRERKWKDRETYNRETMPPFRADPKLIDRIDTLVLQGKEQSRSAFIRRAIKHELNKDISIQVSIPDE